MSVHTPGPWSADLCRYGFAVHAKSGDTIVRTEDDEGRFGTITNEADARLIAAAPDLLEALEALFDRANHHTCTEIGGWFTDNDENVDALRKAEQAIAKAIGGEA